MMTPEQYLDEKRKEIAAFDTREQTVAKTVLLVGQTLCLVLDNQDHEVLQIMKEELDKLFVQADEILKNGAHKVQ